MFSAQTGELVRQELRLAQVEMQEKGKRVGVGAGLLGGARASSPSTASASCWPPRAGCCWPPSSSPGSPSRIVGGALLLLAGLMALLGKKQVEQATPLAPEQAIESTTSKTSST